MSFFDELKRRSVFKVGVTYIIAGWIVIQVADTLLPTYGAPPWIMPVFTTIILLGFPLALVLAWALEVTPIGIRITVDEDTVKGSPSGLILNFIIMGVMAVVIIWLVFDRSRMPETSSGDTVSMNTGQDEQTVSPEETARLPNSIAVLPFENLSPDPNNAYFAAGIHDTVLLELSKISDMNVISRTSVLPYADSNKSIEEIAKELNVETVMEGSVQYAEGQVRITAQLINPLTDAHIWSGNFDRPFSDVFRIQSDIAQSIASAIGATLLPEELQSISRQQTDSEEALALYLQAKALVPNIAPFMPAEARNALREAIKLDPNFAEAYAMLGFHYSLSLGGPDPELTNSERETLAREYAETAIRLNPDLGLAYATLAVLEGAYLRETEQEAFWDQALERSPNDVDVLDDAIRFFASIGKLDKARELSTRVQNINPSSLGTIKIWLAYGSGDFSDFLNYMDNQIGDIRQLDNVAQSFFRSIQAIFEIDRQNLDKAKSLLDEVEALGLTPVQFQYPYMVFGNGLTGRQAIAQRQFDLFRDYFGGQLPVNIASVFVLIGIGDEAGALDMLDKVADFKGSDKGIETNVYIFIKNFYKLPLLEQPEWVAVRQKFGIPLD